MKTQVIYKYEVPTEKMFILQLPAEAKVLTVQVQRGVPQMWVMLDTDAPKVPRVFWLFGTGHRFGVADTDTLNYVGSFQVEAETLIFHLFEQTAVKA